MSKIKVAVVDDNEVDRYIVKRKLSKYPDFGGIEESITGDHFIEDNYIEGNGYSGREPPLLVLMDVNMPGSDGFETVETIQNRMQAGRGPDSIVVMMFTSSDNSLDRNRAKELDIVKGYICKPLDDDDVTTIRTIFEAEAA